MLYCIHQIYAHTFRRSSWRDYNPFGPALWSDHASALLPEESNTWHWCLKPRASRFCQAPSRAIRLGRQKPAHSAAISRASVWLPMTSGTKQDLERPFRTEARHHSVPNPQLLSLRGSHFQFPSSLNWFQKSFIWEKKRWLGTLLLSPNALETVFPKSPKEC